MRVLRRANTFECRDLVTGTQGAHLGDTRADRSAVDQHRATATLRDAAAKARTLKGELLSQKVEEELAGVVVVVRQRHLLTVHSERDRPHDPDPSLFLVYPSPSWPRRAPG